MTQSTPDTEVLPPSDIPPLLQPSAPPDSAAIVQGKAKNRLAYIDALRGTAALWVFLTHVHAYWLGEVRPHGWNLTTFMTRIAGYGVAGVDLFIVLSGFCLFYPLVRNSHKPNLGFQTRAFYERRAFRILPAYYVALSLAALLILSPKLQPLLVSRPIRFTDFLAYVFLIQTFSATTIGSINGSFWTIALEAQLYVMFPVLLWIYKRRGLKGVILAGLATSTVWGIFSKLYISHYPSSPLAPVLDHNFPGRWIEFIAGMTAASLVHHPRPNQSRGAVLVVLATLPLCILSLPLRWSGTISPLVWGAGFAAVIVLLARMPHSVYAFGKPLSLLVNLGTISYSFYLIHQPVLLLAAPLVHRWHLSIVPTFLFSLIVGVPFTASLAYVFFICFERPFLRSATGTFPILRLKSWFRSSRSEGSFKE